MVILNFKFFFGRERCECAALKRDRPPRKIMQERAPSPKIAKFAENLRNRRKVQLNIWHKADMWMLYQIFKVIWNSKELKAFYNILYSNYDISTVAT